MKTILSLLIVLISTTICYGQNDISIKLLEKPSNALSDSEHYYLIDLKNNSTKQFKNLNISVESVSCNSDNDNKSYKDYSNDKSNDKGHHKSHHSNSNLSISILEKDKTTTIHNLNLDNKSSTVFYVKYSTNKNTKLNTANCFEIVIKSSENKNELSNVLTIERLIPDPNDFN